MNRRPLWTHPLVPTVLALVALGVVVMGDHRSAPLQPFRIAAMVGFFCLAPGLAAIRFVLPRGTANEAFAAMVAIGVSLALGVFVSQFMLWIGVWAPRVGVLAMVVLTLALVAVDVRRRVEPSSIS